MDGRLHKEKDDCMDEWLHGLKDGWMMMIDLFDSLINNKILEFLIAI